MTHRPTIYLVDSIQLAVPVAVQQAVTLEEFQIVQSEQCPEPSWWDVQIWGFGSEQVVLTGQTGVTPQEAELRGAQRSVPLQAVLLYEGDRILFDIGAGMRLAVYARSVNLGVAAPVGTVQVRTPGQGGLVNVGVPPIHEQDALIFGQIGTVDAPIGQRLAKLSQSFNITAPGVTVPIPARARYLQVFQNTAGGVAAPMNWRSNVLSLLDLGQIDFQAGVAPFSTQILEIPGNATIVDPGPAVRDLTFVFQQEL